MEVWEVGNIGGFTVYLRMRLNRDSELDVMDEELEAGKKRIIPEVTSRAYVFS